MEKRRQKLETVDEHVAVAEELVERALKAGASDAEVYLRSGRESEIEVRNGEVDRIADGQPRSVGIRVWVGDRSASSLATSLSGEITDRLVRDTIEMAKFADPVPEQRLVDSDYLATELPAVSCSDAGLRKVDPESVIERLTRIEAAAMSSDSRITVSGGARSGDHWMTHAMATSQGFAGGYEESAVSTYVEVIADDEDSKKRNGGWFDVCRQLGNRMPEEELVRRAVERAVGYLGARSIPTTQTTVVFDPYAGGALMRDLFSVLTGSAIERGSSFLSESLGQRIASDILTITDEPLRSFGLGSRPFDGEGLRSRDVAFVEAGELKSFALNSYNARKLGMEPTGHASRPRSGAPGEGFSNFVVAAGKREASEIIGDLADGFYCESMMGFGFNPATGDFSRGASGFVIENGQLTRPVTEVTLSGRLDHMLNNLVEVSSERSEDRSVICPHLVIEGMTVAGSS